MALIATAPILTARGDQLNEADGFIAKFEVKKRLGTVPAAPKTKETEGNDEQAAHSILTIGNCKGIRVDTATGFVGMDIVLHYTQLLCTTDAASLKKTLVSWMRRPTSVAIASTLLRRDRGISYYTRTEDGDTDISVHPSQLLSNIDVGASTRTWLVSTATFTLSYHQIFRAYQSHPQDFADIDSHIDYLNTKIEVLSNEDNSGRIILGALSATKVPYPDFNYTAMAKEARCRLILLSRADLEVFKYIKKCQDKDSAAGKGSKKSRKEEVASSDISTDQLRFLKTVSESNGDLWFERSAHTYDFGDRTGTIMVFPSGYLYSVIGGPGIGGSALMKDRTALARMESLLPYLPYELSGYDGKIESLALVESQIRKGAATKVFSKADLDVAKSKIVDYALRLATAMILDPTIYEITRKSIKAEPVKQPSPQVMLPEASNSEGDTEEIEVKSAGTASAETEGSAVPETED